MEARRIPVLKNNFLDTKTISNIPHEFTRWWQLKFFYVHPEPWGFS